MDSVYRLEGSRVVTGPMAGGPWDPKLQHGSPPSALIVAVASVCYVATWQVVFHRFVPDFPERYTEHVLEKERASGASEAALEEKRAEMAEFAALYRKPLFNIAMTFLEPLPVGLVISLVSAGVLSRRRREKEVASGSPAVAR